MVRHLHKIRKFKLMCHYLVCTDFLLLNLSLVLNQCLDFRFYTGFPNYEIFSTVLDLLVPNGDRNSIKYYDHRNKNQYKQAADFFDSDLDESELSDESQSGDLSKALPRKHILSVEDEFLLTLMKLKPGLQNQDLAIRFQIAVSTVSKLFITWINLIYAKLGSLKVFPKRELIQANMTSDFKEKYPSTMHLCLYHHFTLEVFLTKKYAKEVDYILF